MCTVSNIVDFGRQVSPEAWTPDLYMEFQLLLQRMAEIDKKLGLADCEDASKKTWMKSIEERLANIEASTKSKKKKSKSKGKKSK
jgi:hypothetical protein